MTRAVCAGPQRSCLAVLSITHSGVGGAGAAAAGRPAILITARRNGLGASQQRRLDTTRGWLLLGGGLRRPAGTPDVTGSSFAEPGDFVFVLENCHPTEIARLHKKFFPVGLRSPGGNVLPRQT